MFEVRVTLDGAPLRYTFVSHQPDFRDTMVALTDDDGVARFPDIDAGATIDVVVHAQNLAVRMLDGTATSSVEKSLRFRNKKAGARLNVSRRDASFDHYDIMARCYDTYETVFRPIAPFTGSARRAFPFGGAGDEPHELRRNPQVDCRFPETVAPGKLPWVQPQSVTGGRPLMHLKAPTVDSRLFGTKTKPATTVPHEFAHAVHFSLLSTTKRWLLAAKYGLWIATELAEGNSGTHRTEKRTAPLIAYTEAIGIFSQRFYLFATRVRPDLSGEPLRAAFVADELSPRPALSKLMPGYVKIATRNDDGHDANDAHDRRLEPRLHGPAVEGAVYGAVFLDLADRLTLATVVNLYLRCGAFDVGGFLDYVAKQRRGSYRSAVRNVAATWGLSAKQ